MAQQGGVARGLDRDLAAKRAASYDTRLERELRSWIEGVTGERASGTFHQYLRSGVVLCKFVVLCVSTLAKKIGAFT